MQSNSAIILITTSFPIRGDGSEAAGGFVADFAIELARHLPVRVVAPGRDPARESWQENVEVFRYRAPEKPLSTLKFWSLGDLNSIRQVLRSGAQATQLALDAGPVAHLFALWALPSGHWARRASLRSGAPYSVWTLGSDIWSLGRLPLIRSYLRIVLRDAQHCYSDGLKLAKDTRLIGRRDVEFLPSTRRITFQRTELARTTPPFRLLFLGRWHLNKGIDLLLDALKMLSAQDWQRIDKVTIAGGGPLNSMVRSSVAELQRQNRPVELRGYLSSAEAQAAMVNADYLLIPSRIESIPVVFSDAMKLALPVIANPVGDLPSLLETGAGILARQPNAHSFCEAIRESFTSQHDHEALSATARRFDLASIAKRIAEAVNPKTDDA